MPTYLDKPSHDAYEIAQPEGRLDAERDVMGRKNSPASGWLFKPREDPRALFIRPTSTLGGNGKEGLWYLVGDIWERQGVVAERSKARFAVR